MQALDEVKVRELEVVELQKKIAEGETRLKQQQALYEAVRADRNLYSKQLTETQDEIAEIKRRYKIVNYQIAQLKEEIDAKENALSREHAEHKKKDKILQVFFVSQEKSRDLEMQKSEIEQKEQEPDRRDRQALLRDPGVHQQAPEAERGVRDHRFVLIMKWPKGTSWARSSSGATTSPRCSTRRSRFNRTFWPRARLSTASGCSTSRCSTARCATYSVRP